MQSRWCYADGALLEDLLLKFLRVVARGAQRTMADSLGDHGLIGSFLGRLVSQFIQRRFRCRREEQVSGLPS